MRRIRPAVALVLGVAATASYLAGAALSGHLSILARLPVLDGLTPPPPYRWVSPPPSLAAGNKPATGKKFTIALKPAGSVAGVFATPDGQANLVLSQNAIPRSGQDASVSLSIEPLAPSGLGAPPDGFTIQGNVYRVQASYSPSGAPVGTLRAPSEAILSYPAAAGPHRRHFLLESADGKTWTKLPDSIDSAGQLQVTATITSLGNLAVATKGSSQPVPGSSGSSGEVWLTRILVLAVVGVAVVIAVLQRRQRRRQRASARHGAGRPAQGGKASRPGQPPPRRKASGPKRGRG